MDEWSGMKVKKPFNFVKAIYMIYFPNMDPLNSVVDNNIPVFHDEDVEETYNALKKEIEYRYPGKDSEVKKVILDDQPKVGIVSTNLLRYLVSYCNVIFIL